MLEQFGTALDGGFVVTGSGHHGLRQGAIHDLIDRVDGFPFAGTAAQNEDPRDEQELRIIVLVRSQASAVLLAYDTGNAHGLPAVSTQHTAKMLTNWFGGHQDNSLDRFQRGLRKQKDTESPMNLSTPR
jgi:hypothetical protein